MFWLPPSMLNGPWRVILDGAASECVFWIINCGLSFFLASFSLRRSLIIPLLQPILRKLINICVMLEFIFILVVFTAIFLIFVSIELDRDAAMWNENALCINYMHF